MSSYIIENELTRPEELKNFNLDDYQFNNELSTNEYEMVFTRDQFQSAVSQLSNTVKNGGVIVKTKQNGYISIMLQSVR